MASITRWAAPIVHPHEPHAFYGLLNANFMSSFSIFPALALQSLSPGLRRKRIRLFLWFLVIIFALAVEALYRYVYGAYFQFLWNQDTMVSEDIWLAKCDSHKMRSILASMTTAGHVFLALNCLRWLYHATATFRRGSLEKLKNGRVDYSGAGPWRRRWEASQPYLRLLDGAVCGLFMWTFLFLFTAYREAVKQKAGESDQDAEWTFGQVLSLVTWAPVALELITIYLCESFSPRTFTFAAFLSMSVLLISWKMKPKAVAKTKALLLSAHYRYRTHHTTRSQMMSTCTDSNGTGYHWMTLSSGRDIAWRPGPLRLLGRGLGFRSRRGRVTLTRAPGHSVATQNTTIIVHLLFSCSSSCCVNY